MNVRTALLRVTLTLTITLYTREVYVSSTVRAWLTVLNLLMSRVMNFSVKFVRVRNCAVVRICRLFSTRLSHV